MSIPCFVCLFDPLPFSVWRRLVRHGRRGCYPTNHHPTEEKLQKLFENNPRKLISLGRSSLGEKLTLSLAPAPTPMPSCTMALVASSPQLCASKSKGSIWRVQRVTDIGAQELASADVTQRRQRAAEMERQDLSSEGTGPRSFFGENVARGPYGRLPLPVAPTAAVPRFMPMIRFFNEAVQRSCMEKPPPSIKSAWSMPMEMSNGYTRGGHASDVLDTLWFGSYIGRCDATGTTVDL